MGSILVLANQRNGGKFSDPFSKPSLSFQHLSSAQCTIPPL